MVEDAEADAGVVVTELVGATVIVGGRLHVDDAAVNAGFVGVADGEEGK